VDSILATIIGIVGTGFVSLLGAIIMGKLVPVSRVAAAEAEADKFQLAFETLRRSSDLLEETVKRQHAVTDTANMLISMIKQAAQTPLPPQPHIGGPA